MNLQPQLFAIRRPTLIKRIIKIKKLEVLNDTFFPQNYNILYNTECPLNWQSLIDDFSGDFKQFFFFFKFSSNELLIKSIGQAQST